MHPGKHRSLSILQVSPGDGLGGAERVALALHGAYRTLGYTAWLAVGRRTSSEEGVLPIPNDARRSPWARRWLNMAGRAAFGGSPSGDSASCLSRHGGSPADRVGNAGAPKVQSLLRRSLKAIAEPGRYLRIGLGYEDFDYPATSDMAALPPQKPSILHAHNLHGSYFDLRALPDLSSQVPTVLSLHDAWLLSGHCAHSFDCERWKTGCGRCPDLTIDPAIRRDATAHNWKIKRAIYRRSRFHVTTACRWLMGKVEESILQPGIVSRRVIPNGVDLELFTRQDRNAVRRLLGLPIDVPIILFSGKGFTKPLWRDPFTLRNAFELLAREKRSAPPLLLGFGEAGSETRIGSCTIRLLPYLEMRDVVRHYQAADLYVHPARADTFPNMVLESLACGTPVVATAVCGIPEQIHSLHVGQSTKGFTTYGPDSATGILTPAGDSESLARAIGTLLDHEDIRRGLAENAYRDARMRFDLKLQARTLVDWFGEILG